MMPVVEPLSEQPIDSRKSCVGCCCLGIVVFTVFGMCGCGGLWLTVYEEMFVDHVSIEALGWRFQAKYEGIMGRSTQFSRLTYSNQPFDGNTLPSGTHLVTPIGEFIWGSEWDAVWSEPPITSSEYKVSKVAPESPWVSQIEHSHDMETLIAKGAYQAPPDLRPYDIPWSRQQFKDTPSHWVYVYRLHWGDGKGGDYESHSVEGYWVDPARVNELDWISGPPTDHSKVIPQN